MPLDEDARGSLLPALEERTGPRRRASIFLDDAPWPEAGQRAGKGAGDGRPGRNVVIPVVTASTADAARLVLRERFPAHFGDAPKKRRFPAKAR
ncbi:hypothetical protein KM043_003359 [Ampulex compressa]|nr:hypothetical protein KM043_003359 [Ampulex compressa]